MNIRRQFGLCATLMLAVPISSTAAVSTKAATPQLSLPSLTAAQIVERNAAARGGQSAWRHVQSMTLTGKMDAGKTRRDGGAIAMNPAMRKAQERKALFQPGQQSADVGKVIQLPFQMDLQRPVKSRLEIPFQGQTAVQVYDGTNGWKLRPFLGRHEVEPFTPEEKSLAAGQLPLDGALIDPASKGIKVALDGAETVEGQNAYRLKLTLKNGDTGIESGCRAAQDQREITLRHDVLPRLQGGGWLDDCTPARNGGSGDFGFGKHLHRKGSLQPAVERCALCQAAVAHRCAWQWTLRRRAPCC
jgi:hypothetical protein